MDKHQETFCCHINLPHINMCTSITHSLTNNQRQTQTRPADNTLTEHSLQPQSFCADNWGPCVRNKHLCVRQHSHYRQMYCMQTRWVGAAWQRRGEERTAPFLYLKKKKERRIHSEEEAEAEGKTQQHLLQENSMKKGMIHLYFNGQLATCRWCDVASRVTFHQGLTADYELKQSCTICHLVNWFVRTDMYVEMWIDSFVD